MSNQGQRGSGCTSVRSRHRTGASSEDQSASRRRLRAFTSSANGALRMRRLRRETARVPDPFIDSRGKNQTERKNCPAAHLLKLDDLSASSRLWCSVGRSEKPASNSRSNRIRRACAAYLKGAKRQCGRAPQSRSARGCQAGAKSSSVHVKLVGHVQRARPHEPADVILGLLVRQFGFGRHTTLYVRGTSWRDISLSRVAPTRMMSNACREAGNSSVRAKVASSWVSSPLSSGIMKLRPWNLWSAGGG